MSKKSSKAGLKPSKRPVQNEVNANQWQGSPKQELFLSYYFNPAHKKTFGNAYKSAIRAGYADGYARIVATPGLANQWLEEGRAKMRRFDPEHIIQGIQAEATKDINKGSERLKAYELLAKMQGMLVDRSITAHVNVEQALSELQ